MALISTSLLIYSCSRMHPDRGVAPLPIFRILIMFFPLFIIQSLHYKRFLNNPCRSKRQIFSERNHSFGVYSKIFYQQSCFCQALCLSASQFEFYKRISLNLSSEPLIKGSCIQQSLRTRICSFGQDSNLLFKTYLKCQIWIGNHGRYSPKVFSGSEPLVRPKASLTFTLSHFVFLRIPANPVTSPPQTSMMYLTQLQQPSMGPTQPRAQEQRQYLMPLEQWGMASPKLPHWVEWQMGAQTAQQQWMHSRSARQQASQAAHWSMHIATWQAQLWQQRQVKTFWQVFIFEVTIKLYWAQLPQQHEYMGFNEELLNVLSQICGD